MDGLDGVQLIVHFISSPEVEVESSIALDIQFSSVDVVFYSFQAAFFVLACSLFHNPLRRLDRADPFSRESEPTAAEGSRRRFLIHT